MAVVKTGKVIEKMTAAYLVKVGKANPDQQKLAYEYFTEQIKKAGKKAPRGISKETLRNVMIARYIQLHEADGESISDKQACRDVAEDGVLKFGTIERGFREWKAQDEKAKQADYRNVEKHFWSITSGLVADE